MFVEGILTIRWRAPETSGKAGNSQPESDSLTTLTTIQIPPGHAGLIATIPITPGSVVSFGLEIWLSFDGGVTYPKFQASGSLTPHACPVRNRDGSAAASWSMSGGLNVGALVPLAAAGMLFAQARLIDPSDPALAVALEAVS